MLHVFEDMARKNPRHLCFTAVDSLGRETLFTYHQARLYGSALAQCLQKAGVSRGDYVSVELENVAAWPLLLLAAAYGNFALLGMDVHLTAAEKAVRRNEIECIPNTRISFCVDDSNVDGLMEHARALIDGEDAEGQAERAFRVSLSSGPARAGYLGSGKDSTKLPPSQLRRYATDAEEAVVHFADRANHLFDPSKPAIALFTQGVTGKSKPVCLTWANISQSSSSVKTALCLPGRGVWQAVLPFYRIEGLQVFVRSIINRSSFALYRHFDSKMLMDDVADLGATHISVDQNMLRNMMDTDQEGVLARYTCVLLTGSALDDQLEQAIRERKIKACVGYGLTETAGQVALCVVDERFDGALRLLDDVRVKIVDAGPDGYGRLALSGPMVCERYLGSRTPATVDGYLFTGDTARMENGFLRVHGRTDDMFVCGRSNVFPGDIRKTLMEFEHVSNAYVFGGLDARRGRVPVAFVERGDRGVLRRESTRQFAARLMRQAQGSLSRDSVPARIFPLDSLPRGGTGKVDAALLEQCFEQRLEIAKVTLHRVSVPFAHPTVVAGQTCTNRASLIVEITDYAGRSGLGECVAYASRGNRSENMDEAEAYLSKVLIPHVLGEAFLHPGEVIASLMECPDAQKHPRSLGALEPAFWDLYGKIACMPLWQLIGGISSESKGTQTRVRAGALVELGDVRHTVEAVWRCAEAGYSCVTIEVRPGMAYDRIRAVRQVFPDLMITLDAKQSFTEQTLGELRKLDDLGISWIEEPFSLASVTSNDPRQRFALLNRLQEKLKTPICLDESIPTLQDALAALDYPNLRYMVARVGEFGGVQPTLDFVRCALTQGVRVWMGGMYDLGISRKTHAAFQTLRSVEAAGNTGSVLRQFALDIADPPHTVERGLVTLNRSSAPYGIGCRLSDVGMKSTCVKSLVIER